MGWLSRRAPLLALPSHNYKQQQQLRPHASGHFGINKNSVTAAKKEEREIRMSSMAWYLHAESGSFLSDGNDLFENQRDELYWTLWNSRLSDDLNTANIYPDKHGKGAAVQCLNSAEHQMSNQSGNSTVSARVASSDCSTGPSEEQSEGPAPMELQHTEQTNDIFLTQFSDEEMRMMDAPFQALDMFPDSMHRLMSYENMLSGVLTNFQDQEANLDQNEMDTMDTCGFPLFSHDLQDDLSNADGSSPSCVKLKPNSSEIPVDTTSQGKAGVSTIMRSRSVADTDNSTNSEAAVLEELEEVVFQLTKKMRVCLRDAFYRLSESSNAQRTAANGAKFVFSDEQGFQQPGGTEFSFRVSTSGCAERETNAIDRTVAILTFTG